MMMLLYYMEIIGGCVMDCKGQLMEVSIGARFGGAYGGGGEQTIVYGDGTFVFLGEYTTNTGA